MFAKLPSSPLLLKYFVELVQLPPSQARGHCTDGGVKATVSAKKISLYGVFEVFIAGDQEAIRKCFRVLKTISHVKLYDVLLECLGYIDSKSYLDSGCS
jgi:hypothetical protein